MACGMHVCTYMCIHHITYVPETLVGGGEEAEGGAAL